MNTDEQINIPETRKIPQVSRLKPSLCTSQTAKNLPGFEVQDSAYDASANMNKINQKKSFNNDEKPTKSPHPPSPNIAKKTKKHWENQARLEHLKSWKMDPLWQQQLQIHKPTPRPSLLVTARLATLPAPAFVPPNPGNQSGTRSNFCWPRQAFRAAWLVGGKLCQRRRPVSLQFDLLW